MESIHDVIELEKACFAYHWTEEQFRLGLERNAFHIFGVREEGRLVGYLAFSMIVDEMEILNLAVHPDFRRRGLARRLLAAVMDVCREKGMQSGFLDVKESNAPAISLYEDFGFQRNGRRKRYYPDTKEDALLYRYDFSGE
ncbi:ribosomal protein S18-alanine N-acetyltransferase [Salidesulfovibrio onnuriiensis]|uniref:ribosomal protein S18-alanine N-acetyltransferase n=1 Tax=Salidesulfovibrio onnuriiensis TaxID=2583823 RepID=UPI00202B11EE